MIRRASVLSKTFIIVGIILLIIFVVVFITIKQAYGVMQIVLEESNNIQNNSQLLVEQKDCARLADIENSIIKIESEYSGACKNPILNFAVKQIDAVPVKCENLENFIADFENELNDAKTYCGSDGKLNESIINISIKQEELLALAQKYGIKI